MIRFCNGHTAIIAKTKDFFNVEFAFKYGIWEFLIHDLTPETQPLAAKGYGTDLNFLCIRDQSEKNCDLCFLKGCARHRLNRKIH